MSTCRIAHLNLENSELHYATTAVGNASLEKLSKIENVAVLFPTEDANDVASVTDKIDVLVVVDGTWSNAKKVVERCPLLSRLPRVRFRPDAPSNYRIRKEPADHCVSTVEAVRYCLEGLERAPGKYAPILWAFDTMVDDQLKHVELRAGASRYKRQRIKNKPRFSYLIPLAQHAKNGVVVFCESNAKHEDQKGSVELLQCVVAPLASDEAINVFMRPKELWADKVQIHLGVDSSQMQTALSRDLGLSKIRELLTSESVIFTWGMISAKLLETENIRVTQVIDVKRLASQYLSRKAGGVENAAIDIARIDVAHVSCRAERRARALRAIVRVLVNQVA